MSTKIYNAYKFNKKMSIQQILDWAKPYRQKAQKYVNDQMVKMIIDEYVQDVDRISLGLTIDGFNKYDEGTTELKKNIKKAEYISYLKKNIEKPSWQYFFGRSSNFIHDKNSVSNSDLDPAFCLFQIGNTTAIIVFADFLIGKLNADKALTHYGYWNNTDKPDKVSDREWSQRRRFWDTACRHSPKQDSLMIELTNPMVMDFWSKIFANALKKVNQEKRLTSIARQYRDANNDKYYQADLKAMAKAGSWLQMTQTLNTAQFYKDQLEQIKKQIKPKLCVLRID